MNNYGLVLLISCFSVSTGSKVFTCDKLLLATGHHVTPRIAHFPGIDTFPGSVLHSSAYKDAKSNKLENKRFALVLVN